MGHWVKEGDSVLNAELPRALLQPRALTRLLLAPHDSDVESGPLVRSSYHAAEQAAGAGDADEVLAGIAELSADHITLLGDHSRRC